MRIPHALPCYRIRLLVRTGLDAGHFGEKLVELAAFLIEAAELSAELGGHFGILLGERSITVLAAEEFVEVASGFLAVKLEGILAFLGQLVVEAV